MTVELLKHASSGNMTHVYRFGTHLSVHIAICCLSGGVIKLEGVVGVCCWEREREREMADWGPVVVAVVLFLLLSPGLLFQIPGRRKVVEFGNMQTSGASIMVHSVIYFGLIAIFLIVVNVHIYTTSGWSSFVSFDLNMLVVVLWYVYWFVIYAYFVYLLTDCCSILRQNLIFTQI